MAPQYRSYIPKSATERVLARYPTGAKPTRTKSASHTYCRYGIPGSTSARWDSSAAPCLSPSRRRPIRELRLSSHLSTFPVQPRSSSSEPAGILMVSSCSRASHERWTAQPGAGADPPLRGEAGAKTRRIRTVRCSGQPSTNRAPAQSLEWRLPLNANVRFHYEGSRISLSGRVG